MGKGTASRLQQALQAGLVDEMLQQEEQAL